MCLPIRVSLIIAILLGFVTLSGCRTLPRRTGFADVQRFVDQNRGLSVHWNQGTPEDHDIAENIHLLLQEKLTAGATVQLALLGNRSLQAKFEELGIAQADLVQAGILENPVFEASVRFPDEGTANTEFTVAQNFLDIFLLPLRKKLARAQFERVKLEMENAVLNLAVEVSAAYYKLQGDMQMFSMNQDVMKAAEAAVELASRQFQEGNIDALDFARRKVDYEQAEIDLIEREVEILEHREHLNLLLGIEDHWQIYEQLSELPISDPPLDELLDRALTQRLDLAAARQNIKIFERALTLARWEPVPAIDIGVNAEREPDKDDLIGPTIEMEIPLFDRNQSEKARIRAKLRQSQHRLAAMEHQARSEVRLAYHRLIAARKMTESYRNTLVPLHDEIVGLSQKHYNFMLIGVYTLLQDKQEEIKTRQRYISSLMNYWITRTELERSVGVPLPVGPLNSPLSSHSSPQMSSHSQQSHNHGGE